MKKNIYSILVVFFAIFCLYFYAIIFSSTLRYENNRSLFNYKYFKNSQATELDLTHLEYENSLIYRNYIQNPKEVELYLRVAALEGAGQSQKYFNEMASLYKMLLGNRPTWPYLYSGLMQVGQLQNQIDIASLNKAISYGRHETKVIKSLAEILFHGWNTLNKSIRNKLLDTLLDQPDIKISEIVNIASKFSRIFEYCDLLYEKKHVEYPACKSQYWQPLADE